MGKQKRSLSLKELTCQLAGETDNKPTRGSQVVIDAVLNTEQALLDQVVREDLSEGIGPRPELSRPKIRQKGFQRK